MRLSVGCYSATGVEAISVDGTQCAPHLASFLSAAASHRHLQAVSTPWINQVERFFALLTDQQIKRGAHRSTTALEAAIAAYITDRNADPKPFRWTKTADESSPPLLVSADESSTFRLNVFRNFRGRTLAAALWPGRLVS